MELVDDRGRHGGHARRSRLEDPTGPCGRAVATPPASLQPGAAFRATDTTSNRGRATARASRNRYYLSLNSKKDRADLPLGSRRVPRLKKRKSSRGSARLRVQAGASAGSYLLLACADSGRKVKEANERNNCRASRSCARVGSPDRDGDGTPNTADCAPDNAAIKPGAPDKPDLGFVDSNCDGIDGDQGRAVFVSPAGSDANPGTPAAPKQTVQAGIDAAAGNRREGRLRRGRELLRRRPRRRHRGVRRL